MADVARGFGLAVHNVTTVVELERALVAAAVIVVGAEVLALGAFGTKAWASIYFTPPAPDAIQVQAQAGQFAFYFRYPGPDGKFGPLHPEQISESTENFFGLDTTRSMSTC